MRPERRELLSDPDKFSRTLQHDIITIKNLAGKLSMNDLEQLAENLADMREKIKVLAEFVEEYMKMHT